ncbi:hypothetical protein SASPL_108088 [Salvia splendens]|uniref:SET domain-containing protein n=1 Tax=Salvia splendens TaxID=180675 RepID=A0A8X8YEP5_SALSN|nr:hypothetical protein SASPL_108088 [Salvia splendens]
MLKHERCLLHATTYGLRASAVVEGRPIIQGVFVRGHPKCLIIGSVPTSMLVGKSTDGKSKLRFLAALNPKTFRRRRPASKNPHQNVSSQTIASQSTTTLSCPNCSAASQFCSPQCQSAAFSSSHTPLVCSALRRRLSPPPPPPPPRRPPHPSSVPHRRLPNSGELGFSVELTAALLAKDKLNAFGLMEPFNQGKQRSVRAYSLYPKASFFNHDCLPNACRFDYVDSSSEFSNTDITIRVIHDLPAGWEICLSYFPVNFKCVERQQRLKEDYSFVCDCDRCKVEANWSDDEEEGEGEMDHNDGDDDMDEDGEDEEGDLETTDCGMDKEGEDDSFPHAYFFVRYMCSVDNCGGTLAPLPPVDNRPSTVMECNVCGSFSKLEVRHSWKRRVF